MGIVNAAYIGIFRVGQHLGAGGGGRPRRLAAMVARLARLRAAQDKLAGRALASARSPQSRIAAAQEAADAAARRLEQAEAAQAATMEKYHAAVAAGKPWRFGKIPVPAQENKRIVRLRERAASAAARLAAARDRAAALSPAKVSATDPDSRLVPAKNGGGCTQGWNVQAAAARRQVLLALELHDNPADAGALVDMISAAHANCDLAGLREQIRAWLAGNGYASAANFKALDHLMLLVAVSGEASQTGRAAPTAPPSRPAGRKWPPGWPPRPARACTDAAPPSSSPPSPSSSPGSAATSATAAATPPTPSSSC